MLLPQDGAAALALAPLRECNVLIASRAGQASPPMAGVEDVQARPCAGFAPTIAAAGEHLIVRTTAAIAALRDAAANVGVTYNVHASISFTHSGQPTMLPHRSCSSLSVSASHTGQRGQVYAGGSTGGSIVSFDIPHLYTPATLRGSYLRARL